MSARFSHTGSVRWSAVIHVVALYLADPRRDANRRLSGAAETRNANARGDNWRLGGASAPTAERCITFGLLKIGRNESLDKNCENPAAH